MSVPFPPLTTKHLAVSCFVFSSPCSLSPEQNPCGTVSWEQVSGRRKQCWGTAGSGRMWPAGSWDEQAGSSITEDGVTEPLHSEGVLVSLGCHKNTPQTEWFKQQTFISHRSWGWQIQDQSKGRAASSRPCREKPPHCVLMRQTEGESEFSGASSYKDTNPVTRATPSLPDLTLPPRGPFSKHHR